MASVGSCRWAFLSTASGPESGSVTGTLGSTMRLLFSGWNSVMVPGADFSRLPFWAGGVVVVSVQPRVIRKQAMTRESLVWRSWTERLGSASGMVCSGVNVWYWDRGGMG